MDAGRKVAGARSKGFWAILGLLILSAYGSCREAKFRLWGKEAKGKVTAITRASGKGEPEGYNIHWDPEGGRRSGWTTVSAADVDRFRVGQEVTIEYLDAASMTSRIRGEETTHWPYVFLVSLVLVLCEVVRFLRA